MCSSRSGQSARVRNNHTEHRDSPHLIPPRLLLFNRQLRRYRSDQRKNENRRSIDQERAAGPARPLSPRCRARCVFLFVLCVPAIKFEIYSLHIVQVRDLRLSKNSVKGKYRRLPNDNARNAGSHSARRRKKPPQPNSPGAAGRMLARCSRRNYMFPAVKLSASFFLYLPIMVR